MPLFYQQNINPATSLAIWLITEPEHFFLQTVPAQPNITHPHKRLQHLAGRYLLQFLFPDFPYEEILIADTKKPYLPNEQYHFSISHCGNYAAAIVSKHHRVGIDIEIPSSKVQRVMHKFLSEKEREAFSVYGFQFLIGDDQTLTVYRQQLPAEQQLPTILWCAKEAIFKWWSYGSVNFKEQMHLRPFSVETSGNIDAVFIKEEKQYLLYLNYQLFDELCLVWVKS